MTTKPNVYVETSIVSYLTAQPLRHLIIAAQQAMTREWWPDAPERFVLVASELVFTEASAGDAAAARARLTALEMVMRLDTTVDATALTRRLLELGTFPRVAAADAAHVGIAATNRVARQEASGREYVRFPGHSAASGQEEPRNSSRSDGTRQAGWR